MFNSAFLTAALREQTEKFCSEETKALKRCQVVGKRSSFNNCVKILQEFRANFKIRVDLHKTSHIVQPAMAILFAGAVERVTLESLGKVLWGSSGEVLRKF